MGISPSEITLVLKPHPFQQVVPPNDNYEHDKQHLRHELSDEQRQTEPKNADSHLAFMSPGRCY